jgi:hypothetical protein
VPRAFGTDSRLSLPQLGTLVTIFGASMQKFTTFFSMEQGMITREWGIAEIEESVGTSNLGLRLKHRSTIPQST